MWQGFGIPCGVNYVCARGVGAVPALWGQCGDQGTNTAEWHFARAEKAALASNPWRIFVCIFGRPM